MQSSKQPRGALELLSSASACRTPGTRVVIASRNVMRTTGVRREYRFSAVCGVAFCLVAGLRLGMQLSSRTHRCAKEWPHRHRYLGEQLQVSHSTHRLAVLPSRGCVCVCMGVVWASRVLIYIAISCAHLHPLGKSQIHGSWPLDGCYRRALPPGVSLFPVRSPALQNASVGHCFP